MLTMTQRRVAKSRRPQQQSPLVPCILCVDDDPDFQTMMQLRLRDFDVKLEFAFYGMQGVFETLNTRPNLILVDLAMPNGTGEYLLECVKQNPSTANIPVIIVTGMRDPNLKRRMLQTGAAVFLHKPFKFDELLHHMSRFIDIRKRRVEERM